MWLIFSMIWYLLIWHSEIWHTLNPLGQWRTLQVSRAPRSLLAPRKHLQACNVSSYSTHNDPFFDQLPGLHRCFTVEIETKSFHSACWDQCDHNLHRKPWEFACFRSGPGGKSNAPIVRIVSAGFRRNAAQCAYLKSYYDCTYISFRKNQQYDYDDILISWLRHFALTSLQRLCFRSRGSKHHLHFDPMTGRNGFRCDTEMVWVWRPKTSPFEDREAKTQQVQQTWLPHALEILFKKNTIWKDGPDVLLLEKLFKEWGTRHVVDKSPKHRILQMSSNMSLHLRL